MNDVLAFFALIGIVMLILFIWCLACRVIVDLVGGILGFGDHVVRKKQRENRP